MQNITNLTSLPEWIAVETIIKGQISDLLDIRNIGVALNEMDTKIELKARQLAVTKLLEFYTEHGFSRIRQEEIIVTFE